MKIAPRSTPRRGYTLLEIIVVMAAILILGSFILPTLFGIRGDTRSKAGADMIRGRMNEARAKAMEDGLPYRLAVSSDKKRLRLAPDTFEATGIAPTTDDSNTNGPYVREDDLPDTVMADVMCDPNDQSTQDKAGWVRVATFLPDGTCKEDGVEIDIREPGVVPFIVRLRGLTGAVSVSRGASSGSNR
jgi:prepilin-type N-terminal cleavage/methylation domain-containing protein